MLFNTGGFYGNAGSLLPKPSPLHSKLISSSFGSRTAFLSLSWLWFLRCSYLRSWNHIIPSMLKKIRPRIFIFHPARPHKQTPLPLRLLNANQPCLLYLNWTHRKKLICLGLLLNGILVSVSIILDSKIILLRSSKNQVCSFNGNYITHNLVSIITNG